jgi:hypothetical protein
MLDAECGIAVVKKRAGYRKEGTLPEKTIEKRYGATGIKSSIIQPPKI